MVKRLAQNADAQVLQQVSKSSPGMPLPQCRYSPQDDFSSVAPCSIVTQSFTDAAATARMHASAAKPTAADWVKRVHETLSLMEGLEGSALGPEVGRMQAEEETRELAT